MKTHGTVVVSSLDWRASSVFAVVLGGFGAEWVAGVVFPDAEDGVTSSVSASSSFSLSRRLMYSGSLYLSDPGDGIAEDARRNNLLTLTTWAHSQEPQLQSLSLSPPVPHLNQRATFVTILRIAFGFAGLVDTVETGVCIGMLRALGKQSTT